MSASPSSAAAPPGVELAAELYNAAAELRHYGLEVFDEEPA